MTPGLTRVPTPTLEHLLRLVYREQLPCPFTQVGIVTNKLQDVIDDVGVLKGLDRTAVIAVLVSVLAERRVTAGRASR